MNKKVASILLLFVLQSTIPVNILLADVKVSQLQEMVDWDKTSNYAEAKQVMLMAKEINKEKKRRKQLKDAGVPEAEIKRIILQERQVRENGGKISQTNNANQELSTTGYNNTNNIENNVEENHELLQENQNTGKTIINDYDQYGKTNNYIKQNDSNNNNILSNSNELVIDLSIIPPIPELQKKEITVDTNSNNYDDFELTRMLKKAGDNIDNPNNFAIFAKEVAIIANKPLKKQLPLPKLEITDDDEESEYLFAQKKNGGNKFANAMAKKRKKTDFNGKGNKSNIYDASFHGFYAAADDLTANKNTEEKSITSKRNKHQKTKNNQRQFYADIQKEQKSSFGIGDMMSGKQVKAKNMGAPSPIKRKDTNNLKQYQPQNIAQVSYDKNNQHLQPIVFEKHLIDQVIDNLGTENSVQLARALINKIGKTDITDDDGNTLLMHAVARQNQPLITMLLSEGASPNAVNKEGFAPIHLATSNGDNSSVYALMMSGGNPNLKDNNGNTPLMYAAKMCNNNSIKIMMALGGDPTIVNNSTGYSAFDFAKENNDSNIALYMKTTTQKLLGKRQPVQLHNI